VGKCSRAGQAADDSTGYAYFYLYTKATNTYSEYVIIDAVFPLQQWLHEHASLLRHGTLPVLFSVLTSCCNNAQLAEFFYAKAFLYYFLNKSVFKMTGKHRCEVTSYLILLLVAFPNMRHLRYANEIKYLR